jgi:hypothetical protein
MPNRSAESTLIELKLLILSVVVPMLVASCATSKAPSVAAESQTPQKVRSRWRLRSLGGWLGCETKAWTRSWSRVAGNYDHKPMGASARLTSTRDGQLLADVSWFNEFGHVRKGRSEAASEIAAALAERVR